MKYYPEGYVLGLICKRSINAHLIQYRNHASIKATALYFFSAMFLIGLEPFIDKPETWAS